MRELAVLRGDKPEVINPVTGEVLALSEAPAPVIAHVLGHVQAAIDEQLAQLYDAKRVLGAELIERMDKAGEWTVTAPGVKVIAPSPVAGTQAWDAERLDAILDELVAEGLIDQTLKLRAVEQQVSLKVNLRGVAALSKIPAVAARIAEASLEVAPPVRKASVRVNQAAL